MRTSAKDLVTSALLAALMAATSWLAATVMTVPLTLQTFFVVLAALLLKPKWAVVSQLLYIALGACGLPVFSGGRGGLAVLVGPTGGYLWGFIVATFVTSHILRMDIPSKASSARVASSASRVQRPITVRGLLAGLASIIIINGMGTVMLALVMHLEPGAACTIGVLPFIVGDTIKMLGALIVGRMVFRAVWVDRR